MPSITPDSAASKAAFDFPTIHESSQAIDVPWRDEEQTSITLPVHPTASAHLGVGKPSGSESSMSIRSLSDSDDEPAPPRNGSQSFFRLSEAVSSESDPDEYVIIVDG
ncbi:unnamed protein product, partial [Mesorhabditis spiculigera]